MNVLFIFFVLKVLRVAHAKHNPIFSFQQYRDLDALYVVHALIKPCIDEVDSLHLINIKFRYIASGHSRNFIDQ